MNDGDFGVWLRKNVLAINGSRFGNAAAFDTPKAKSCFATSEKPERLLTPFV
jgi:hypothetical protein